MRIDCTTRSLDEGARTSHVEIALRDTVSLIGDSTFRPNSALIDFQFPGDMYAHAHVFTQPGSIRGHPPRRHPPHFPRTPSFHAGFFIPGALSRISSNQMRAATAAHDRILRFFYNGRGERNKKR